MTYSAKSLNQIAELLLDRMQMTSEDIARNVGMTLRTAEDHLRDLQRQGRVHRVHQTVPLSDLGPIWAPGRRLKIDGQSVFEPVQLTVSTWKPAPFRTSALEAHFFGRMPAPTMLGTEPMVGA